MGARTTTDVSAAAASARSRSPAFVTATGPLTGMNIDNKDMDRLFVNISVPKDKNLRPH